MAENKEQIEGVRSNQSNTQPESVDIDIIVDPETEIADNDTEEVKQSKISQKIANIKKKYKDDPDEMAKAILNANKGYYRVDKEKKEIEKRFKELEANSLKKLSKFDSNALLDIVNDNAELAEEISQSEFGKSFKDFTIEQIDKEIAGLKVPDENGKLYIPDENEDKIFELKNKKKSIIAKLEEVEKTKTKSVEDQLSSYKESKGIEEGYDDFLKEVEDLIPEGYTGDITKYLDKAFKLWSIDNENANNEVLNRKEKAANGMKGGSGSGNNTTSLTGYTEQEMYLSKLRNIEPEKARKILKANPRLFEN